MSNIIVVFPKIEEARGIKNLLVRNGYSVAVACTSAAQALSMADNLGSGVIVSGYRLSDTIYTAISENMPEGFELLLITSQLRWSECQGNGIMCLAMPLKVNDLVNTVEMILTNLARKRKKLKQRPRKRNPEEQKIIDDAKEILMEKNNMTEEEAHRYLQKNSMDSGNTMVEYSKMVLEILYR